MWLNKGDYPENSHVVFSPNKQRSFEPFVCLNLTHDSFDVRSGRGLQALVYILPSTTTIVDYAMGLEKLSANGQFFDDAQTAVSL